MPHPDARPIKRKQRVRRDFGSSYSRAIAAIPVDTIPDTAGRPLLRSAVEIAQKRGLAEGSLRWWEVCEIAHRELIEAHMTGQRAALARLDDLMDALAPQVDGRPDRADLARIEMFDTCRSLVRRLMARVEPADERIERDA